VSIGFAGTLIPNDKLFENAGTFATKPGRFKLYLALKLDGSDEASKIDRQSKSYNEVLLVDRSKWRSFRQSPFQLIDREFMNTPRGVLMMNSQNHGVIAPESVPESEWLEIVLSPLRLGVQLGLLEQNVELEQLIGRLKKDIVQNSTGNKMELEAKPDGLQIHITGSYLQDKTTKVIVDSTWQYIASDKISENDLNQSLMRSL
jgi:hypothetical protein